MEFTILNDIVLLLTELLEKVSDVKFSTATPLELQRLKDRMKYIRVPEDVQWSTKKEYENKSREVSVSDTGEI